MNNYLNTDGFSLVELRVPGVAVSGQSGVQFNFLDQPYLRPDVASIRAITLYTFNSITGSPVSTGTLASVAITKTASLTLVSDGFNIVQKLPVVALNVIQNASTDPFVREYTMFNNLRVDWTKSFVSMTAAPANTTDIYFVFGVYYDRVGKY